MTEHEQQELHRLKYNMQRLATLAERQCSTIVNLRSELARQAQELDALRRELAEAERRCSTTRAAVALAGSTSEREQAAGYLEEIIKEVECCISQLKAEQALYDGQPQTGQAEDLDTGGGAEALPDGARCAGVALPPSGRGAEADNPTI